VNRFAALPPCSTRYIDVARLTVTGTGEPTTCHRRNPAASGAGEWPPLSLPGSAPARR
jgi:hypothetical protein